MILPDLYGRALGMTKMMLAFLSIGSIGYFWFEKPHFVKRVFDEVKDLNQQKFKLEDRAAAQCLEQRPGYRAHRATPPAFDRVHEHLYSHGGKGGRADLLALLPRVLL